MAILKQFFVCTVLLCVSNLLLAAEPTTSEDDSSPTEQTVNVNNITKDKDIAARLERILAASGWIQDSTVKVDQGVVILTGIANSQKHSDWAEDLAKRTSDVTAVINKIQLSKTDAWSLEPAKKEAKSLLERFNKALPTLAIVILILILTWIISRLFFKFINKILSKRIDSPFIQSLSAKLLTLPLLLIGFYLVMRISGMSQLATTIIGGTGLMGLILGIAFRDIVENFLASVLISVQRPFRISDIIEVDGCHGVVQNVTTRGTVIMTLEGNYIQIPNSTIYKSTITNYTANPKTRGEFIVGIGYTDNISQTQALIKQLLSNHVAVIKDPEPQVLVENLAASTVNLIVYFWIDNRQHSRQKVRSALLKQTKLELDKAGISMPDEAREVVFPEGITINDESTNNPPSSKEKTSSTTSSKTSESTAKADDTEDLSSEVNDIQEQSKDFPLIQDNKDLINKD